MDLSNLKRIKDDIIKQYDVILKLPENEKKQVLQRLYIIQEIEKCEYRRESLSKAGLKSETMQEEQKINNLIQTLTEFSVFQLKSNKPTLNRTRQSVDVNGRINIVMNFMKGHIKRVGNEQAIKDFQYGLNILNKNRKNSSIEVFRQLEEDGDFGNKTYACLANICRYYSPRIICKSIKKGAITNAIFNTKNDKRINTEKKIEQIKQDLKLRGRI